MLMDGKSCLVHILVHMYFLGLLHYNIISIPLSRIFDNMFLTISGPFTILAPTDFAFGKIGLALLNSLQNDLSQLQKTLEYHVINGFILVPMIHGHIEKTTLEGQSVILSGHGGKVKLQIIFISVNVNTDVKMAKQYFKFSIFCFLMLRIHTSFGFVSI